MANGITKFIVLYIVSDISDIIDRVICFHLFVCVIFRTFFIVFMNYIEIKAVDSGTLAVEVKIINIITLFH